MSQYVLHLDTYGRPYLAHHGIKGQRWGVRRFQNSDGTWTAAGKIRYGSGESKQKTAKEDIGKTKLKDIDHKKDGSNKGQVAMFLASVGMHTITMNPVGLAVDLGRGAMAVGSTVKENQAKKRIAKAETDPETGLKLKAKETTADQDLKMTNPGYHNFNTNTKNNCVLCSTAFELRRRGYDVIAEKAGVGYTSEEYTKWFKGAKTELYDGKVTSVWSIPKGTNLRERRQELNSWTESKILSQGEGARGYLTAVWAQGGGHSMAYEVKNGAVVVYDAQCGKKRTLKSIANASIDMGYTRLDDKEPNWAAMKKVGAI